MPDKMQRVCVEIFEEDVNAYYHEAAEPWMKKYYGPRGFGIFFGSTETTPVMVSSPQLISPPPPPLPPRPWPVDDDAWRQWYNATYGGRRWDEFSFNQHFMIIAHEDPESFYGRIKTAADRNGVRLRICITDKYKPGKGGVMCEYLALRYPENESEVKGDVQNLKELAIRLEGRSDDGIDGYFLALAQ